VKKQSENKKLALKRETLRDLTKPELRLVAGGGASVNYSNFCG